MQLRWRAVRLLPLAFVLMGSAALAAPVVTVSPTGDHPQGSTKVSGTGFDANEHVDIYFDTTDEKATNTDATGAFGPITLPVPASALPGQHWITAIDISETGAQHAFLVRTNWPSIGFNDQGQRHNLYENVIDATNVGNLGLAWTAKVGGTGYSVTSSPTIAQVTGTYNPYVFVGADQLYAFDSSGKLVWKKLAGSYVDSGPTVSGTTVYAGSADGKLYAFNAANGAPLWASPATGGYIGSSPTVANGIVYVGSYDDKVYAFHTSDGTPAWPSPAVTGAHIFNSSPAVASGLVYIGSSDGTLYAFDANTGATVWTFKTSDEIIYANPAVADGVVYFGSATLGGEESGKFHAVNARTGKQKWAVTFPDDFITASAAVANGVVYIGVRYLYAFRAGDGALLWKGEGGGTTTVANGVVYVGGDYGIAAFNASGCGSATCPPLWIAENDSDAPPVISNGFVYVSSQDHKLYAYALNGGDTPAYTFRKNTKAPSFASLHPDTRLKPVWH